MKIVFFGAGDFAFPIAKRVGQDFTLLAVVVTKPRPRGRGRKVPRVGHVLLEFGHVPMEGPDDSRCAGPLPAGDVPATTAD